MGARCPCIMADVQVRVPTRSGASAQDPAGIRMYIHQRWSLDWARKGYPESKGGKGWIAGWGVGRRGLVRGRAAICALMRGRQGSACLGARGVVQKEPSVVSGLRRGLRGQVMVAAAQSHCGLQDINGILQHVAFCVWLLSLSMMFSGVFHDVT